MSASGDRLARVGSALVAVAVIGGCEFRRRVELELREPSMPYAFLVMLRSDGIPLSISSVFGVEQGRLELGALPGVELAGDEDRALLVTLDDATLAGAARGFDADRALEITASLEAPPAECPGGAFAGDATRVRVGLPGSATVLGVDLARNEAIAPADARAFGLEQIVTLSVPIDAETCGPPWHGNVRPFGDRARLLPADVRVGTSTGAQAIKRLVRIDEDRVLACSDRFVFLLERGRPFVNDGRHAVPLEEAVPGGPTGLSFRSVAVDRAGSSTSGPMRAAATAAVSTGSGGALLELVVDGRELRLVRTVTVTPERLYDVAFDGRGEMIAVGLKGSVLTVGREGAISSRRLDAPLQRLRIGGVSAEALTIGTHDGAVLEGTVRGPADGFELSNLHVLVLDTVFHVDSLAVVGGERWAAGTNGHVFLRRPGAAWGEVAVNLPPSVAACAATPDACGHRRPFKDVGDLTVIGDWAVLIPDRCGGAIAIRRSDLCASGIPLLGGPIEIVAEAEEIKAIDAHGGRLTIGGTEGLLLEIGPEPR